MTNPTNEQREQARAIRFPFPCGCMDAHEGGGMAVEEYTCAAHRLIAEALSSRDREVREVLEGLITCTLDVGEGPQLHWCPIGEDSDMERGPSCDAAHALYTKLQPKEVGDADDETVSR